MFDETIASRVRPLAEAFRAAALVRLTVRDDEFEVEFRRKPAVATTPATSADRTAEAGGGPAPALPKAADILTSDVVGVVRFMRPPAVEGQHLEGDRDLAFVETLGIRNPIRSRGSGTIAAVFVTDAQPVEYGQPLFAIER